jgi:predicted O-methyltransferase YrrM
MTENIRLLGLTNIEMLVNTSQVLMPQLIQEERSFDLVFVDGDHRYGMAQFDLSQGWRVLVQGGTMAAHDYGEVTCPEVMPAVDDWATTLDSYGAQAYPHEVVDTLWTIHRTMQA